MLNLNTWNYHKNRHGEQTAGEYHVQLPDGRLQSVNYHVDGAIASGFIADVSYNEGKYNVPAKLLAGLNLWPNPSNQFLRTFNAA